MYDCLNFSRRSGRNPDFLHAIFIRRKWGTERSLFNCLALNISLRNFVFRYIVTSYFVTSAPSTIVQSWTGPKFIKRNC